MDDSAPESRPWQDRAGLGRRFSAAAIDAVFTYFVFAGVAIGMDQWRPLKNPTAVWMYLSVAIGTGAELLFPKSVGKAALRLWVARTDGRATSLGRRAARWSVKLLPVLLLIVHETAVPWQWRNVLGPIAVPLLMGMLLLSFVFTLTPRRLAFHDMIAGTAVYRPVRAQPGGFEVVMPGPATVEDPGRV